MNFESQFRELIENYRYHMVRILFTTYHAWRWAWDECNYAVDIMDWNRIWAKDTKYI